MNAPLKWLAPALALSLPFAALAQSTDAKYCTDLAAKYERYLNMDSKRGAQSQSVDARVGVEKCKSGDTAVGIPALEKALKDAKLDLPPRT